SGGRTRGVPKGSWTGSGRPASRPGAARRASTRVMKALKGSTATGEAKQPSDPADRPVLELEPLVDAVGRALAAHPRLLDAAEGGDFGRDEPCVDPHDPVLERLRDAVHAPEPL